MHSRLSTALIAVRFRIMSTVRGPSCKGPISCRSGSMRALRSVPVNYTSATAWSENSTKRPGGRVAYRGSPRRRQAIEAADPPAIRHERRPIEQSLDCCRSALPRSSCGDNCALIPVPAKPDWGFRFYKPRAAKIGAGNKSECECAWSRESRRSFGENLAQYNIQPVWLSIENETDDQLVYLQIAMDPDYYSPYEVSYRFHGIFSSTANRARDKLFLERQIASTLPPHSRTTGFMYGVLDAGVKYAHIVIAGNDRVETFDFALPVPGPAFVGMGVRADSIYPRSADRRY